MYWSLELLPHDLDGRLRLPFFRRRLRALLHDRPRLIGRMPARDQVNRFGVAVGDTEAAPNASPLVNFGHRLSDLSDRHRATPVLTCNAAMTPLHISRLQPVGL